MNACSRPCNPIDGFPRCMSAPSPSALAGDFATTRWTQVLEARGDSPEARTALAELCEIYWGPVFRFLRREGRLEDQAQELTQEFFARLLARPGLESVERERGRFRSFLLGAVKHFLADRRDHEIRIKRGGGQELASLDAVGAADSAAGLSPAVAGPATPAPSDAYFDRQWAVAIMQRALTELEAEYRSAGRAAHFDALRPWLGGDDAVEGQAEVARSLGLSEGAVRVAIHRLRRAYREAIRREIAQTVPDTDAVDGELRYLVEVLTA